jgi:putative ATPase
LKTLTDTDIKSALELAIEDEERGLGRYKIVINEDALNHIINMANGDARSALNALELAVLTTIPNLDGIRVIDLSVAEESIQQKAVQYDKGGDSHYDIISAFIKSMRGSDPQAALHWLARMLHAGEDPRFIARRIVICAAEDVGMADPQALVIAMTAAQALDYLGMPEARIPLAEAVVYIATAPKSNSAYLAINEALEDIERKKIGSVPSHLRDANYRGAKALGHGQGYKYPHNYPSGWIEQQYLPEELYGVQYYKPTNNGYEEKVKLKMIDK